MFPALKVKIMVRNPQTHVVSNMVFGGSLQRVIRRVCGAKLPALKWLMQFLELPQNEKYAKQISIVKMEDFYAKQIPRMINGNAVLTERYAEMNAEGKQWNIKCKKKGPLPGTDEWYARQTQIKKECAEYAALLGYD